MTFPLNKINLALFRKTTLENKYDALCFNIIIFDILFLPLFPLFSVSMSLPVMCLWFIKRVSDIKRIGEYHNFYFIIGLMVISTLISLVYFDGIDHGTSFSTSCKRLIQYITSFGYFYLFVYFFDKYRRNIANTIFWAMIFIAAIALVYTFNRELFITYKAIISPFDPQIARWLGNELPVYRYNFFWADPNNVAYVVTALCLFGVIHEDLSIIKKYISVFVSIYILLCTMSIGGIGVFGVLIGYVILFSKRLHAGKNGFIIALAMIAVLVLFTVQYWDFIYEIIDSGILRRTEFYGDNGVKGGGGRLEDLMTGCASLSVLFLLVGSGLEGYVTEIGHIYVVAMYGLPVYIFFMYILFAKRKKIRLVEFLPLIPLFVGFTMNIAIIEQKFLLITLLISSYLTSLSHSRNLVRK